MNPVNLGKQVMNDQYTCDVVDSLQPCEIANESNLVICISDSNFIVIDKLQSSISFTSSNCSHSLSNAYLFSLTFSSRVAVAFDTRPSRISSLVST